MVAGSDGNARAVLPPVLPRESAPVSDPIKTRLDRRREELMRRFALIEAAGELDEPGGEIAFAALADEMRHLHELYEVMLLVAMRDNYRRAGWLE
jgi:hypothetical protein